ncbi:hypothetical protein RND81_09G077400 [Saponaria officinalis]|uniref:Micronuclear linker histone polyprotein-like protein n=1 Tax=Saponaria officinalis TaxID=3572 RepID=A0AAW1IIY6_SAPOF
MASSYKSNTNNNNNQRAKPYALMLLLAFGAAILGVMVLHKLREKRIFTLLVKEKDHELLTLHLLFQREQEFNKDARKKIEEMKTKVYSLRSQKLELDRRLLEMESTIASLRDERKVIESSLEEKKNEIKMLTEDGINSTFPRVSALQEMIKMKEMEIKHLKLRLNKTEPNSTGVSTSRDENESQLQVNDSLDKGMKSENESQTNGVFLQIREQSTEETKNLDNVDEDGRRMRQDATMHKWVDENTEKKTDGFRSVGVVNETAAKVNDSSSQDNPREQESRDLTRTLRGVNGSGIRVRRRHSRGARLRTTEAGALSNLKENIESDNSRKEVGPVEIHQAKSEKGDQTRDTGRDGQQSTDTKPKGSDASKGRSMSKEGNEKGKGFTEANATKIDDINREHDIDANRKLLKMRHIDVNKYKSNDEGKEIEVDGNKYKSDEEEGKEIEVDGESDDLEYIREPEIDRADIKRFADSDPDEEEAEEAAEETEF